MARADGDQVAVAAALAAGRRRFLRGGLAAAIGADSQTGAFRHFLTGPDGGEVTGLCFVLAGCNA